MSLWLYLPRLALPYFINSWAIVVAPLVLTPLLLLLGLSIVIEWLLEQQQQMLLLWLVTLLVVGATSVSWRSMNWSGVRKHCTVG